MIPMCYLPCSKVSEKMISNLKKKKEDVAASVKGIPDARRRKGRSMNTIQHYTPNSTRKENN